MMATITELRCVLCERSYAPDSVQYTCPHCGPVGTLDILYDYDRLAQTVSREDISAGREASMWRYKRLLPIGIDAAVPPLQVGFTPLYDAPRLTSELVLRRVWAKDDGKSPTGMLEVRPIEIAVARAMEQGIDTVSTASTGNAAAALAGAAASVGLRTIIFVPAAAPEAKIAQLLVYGATVILVEDTYDVAFDLCAEMSALEGWYCRNT